eukprot:scaffold2788_cov137-Isochrysis_galbana.AAC.3
MLPSPCGGPCLRSDRTSRGAPYGLRRVPTAETRKLVLAPLACDARGRGCPLRQYADAAAKSCQCRCPL